MNLKMSYLLRALSVTCFLTVVLLIACSSDPSGPTTPEAATDPTKLSMKYKDYNLVFVSFDALQGRHVSHLGYPRNVTPTLDAIADKSFGFTHAHSVSSWTVPSTMTWFTGAYPSEHGLTNKYRIYTDKEKKNRQSKRNRPTNAHLG